MSSVKINAVMSALRTLILLAFPLLTFPYVSRLFGPAGMGWIGFATALSGYFVLFASMGVQFYGVREIAKLRDNQGVLAEKAQEILVIHLLASMSVFVIYLLVILVMPALRVQRQLFFIYGLLIPVTALGVEWLYQGTERYVYITVRTLVFTLVSMAGIFVLLKQSDQAVVYGLIIVFSAVGVAAANVFGVRKILFGKRLRPFIWLPHIRGMLSPYLIVLVSSLYLNVDVVFLGLMASPESVGYYSAASKFLTVVWSLIASAGAVLVPRLSYYSEAGRALEFQSVVNKSITMTVILCVPAMTAVFFLSKDLILLFAGREFLAAIDCLNITLPGLFFASLANIFVWHVLFPQKRDRTVILSLLFVAVISVGCNLLLIPHFSHTGAAVAKFLSELVAFLVLWRQARLVCEFRVFPVPLAAKVVLSTAFMVIVIQLVQYLFLSPLVRLCFAVLSGSVAYLLALLVLREKFVFGMIFARIHKG